MTKLLKAYLSAICLLITATTGCSPTSVASQEGALGALAGSLLGGGVGAYLGHERGNMAENVALNAAIGGGLGLLGGAMLNDQNLKVERQREVVIRQAQLVNKNQREIDQLREQVYDNSSWGGNETRPWNQRYQTEVSDDPYQGSTAYQAPNSH